MTYMSVLRNFAAVIISTSFFFTHATFANAACENLPVLNNGQLLLEGRGPPFMLNENISYECDENFMSDQINPKISCILRDNVANWTSTEGACKPKVISCNFPGDVENANIIGSVFTFPHNITYICKEGFWINGYPTKHCSKTGQWLPPRMPFCEAIYCPALSHPPNGKVLLTTNRHPNSIATYKCDRYYNLVGDSVRVCQGDGTWNGSNPICKEITCAEPDGHTGVRIINKKDIYTASDIIIFQCYGGSKQVTSKCLDNGEWNNRAPVCPDSEKRTLVQSTSTDVPDKENEKEETLVPSTSTTVSEERNEKEVNSCEDPGKIKNGDRMFVGLHINSTVTYTCDEGYQLRGKSTLLCLESGKWDLDKLPICVKPLSVPAIIGIVLGVIIFISICIGGYFGYRYRMKSIRGYGKKSKALTADATDIEEITGLEREKKQIPVTVL